MVENSGRRRVQILLLLFVCTVVSFQPIALSGSTYWDVTTDWSFYSGSAASTGPISFLNDATYGTIQITGGFVQFTDLSIAGGYRWSNIGFHCPSSADMTVLSISSSELRIRVNASTGSTTFPQVYVPGMSRPGDVVGSSDWNFSGSQIITFQLRHSSPVDVTIKWTGDSVGVSGGVSDTPLIPPIPQVIIPANWWAEKGSVLIAALVIGVVVYNQVKESSPSQRKRDAYKNLLPHRKGGVTTFSTKPVEDSLKKFAEKLKEDMWKK